jgi:hypothetical protein
VAELLDHDVTCRRRTGCLFACFVALAVPSCSAASRAEPRNQVPNVTVTNGASPGAFSLRNEGSRGEELARDVAVERRNGELWERMNAPVELIQSCDQARGASCMTLPAGATWRPIGWNGFSCGPQCPSSCRANIYLGPGTYRFVVNSCDRTRQFTGPPFELPAERK